MYQSLFTLNIPSSKTSALESLVIEIMVRLMVEEIDIFYLFIYFLNECYLLLQSLKGFPWVRAIN